MHALPPLNALRAFEVAARHLSLTKAAAELNVTPGALSHQVRGLEEMLGVKLFDRGVRSLTLTDAGRRLYPGLRTAFTEIRDAVASVRAGARPDVLVVSTPPGFTAKWLAPRLYRFSVANPEVDIRVSSSMGLANFTSDGVDVAVRMLRADHPGEPGLVMERLADLAIVPVLSPALAARHGPLTDVASLRGVPLIHDDGRGGLPGWDAWFEMAGVEHPLVGRGLRFSSADHALDAVIEGAGVMLASNILAYDELRTGRLTVAVPLTLPSGRAYFLVTPRRPRPSLEVAAFADWIRREIAALDWSRCKGCTPA